jgi:hypothetical protein
VHTEFWWEILRKGDYLKNPGVDGRIILKMDLREAGRGAGIGSKWLRIGIGDRFF